MDRLQSIEAFLRVAEAGSFTAAAQRLGLSKSRVSTQVRELEGHLGTRLIHRTTRRLTLTEAGQRYFERCAPLLEELAEADRAVGELDAAPRGTLRVNVPVTFGQMHLAPVLPRFLARHPELRLDVSLNDRFVDLMHEGYDAALRIGRLQDSSLIARRLADCKMWLCAAPEYLARAGTPQSVGDLAGHEALIYTYAPHGGQWRITDPEGRDQRVAASGRLRANNGELLLAAAVHGSGIVLLPDFIAAHALAAGALRRLLPHHRIDSLSLHVVYPYTRNVSAKVRALVEFLVEQFGGTPPWRAGGERSSAEP